jgi:hypothetical protein
MYFTAYAILNRVPIVNILLVPYSPIPVIENKKIMSSLVLSFEFLVTRGRQARNSNITLQLEQAAQLKTKNLKLKTHIIRRLGCGHRQL